jgi:hypothetical protein
MRDEVFREYGIADGERNKYEIDHLVPVELGGANNIKNLWPEPFDGEWGSAIKDRLENELHRMVCAGEISLRDAQEQIRTNWIELYKRVFAHSL